MSKLVKRLVWAWVLVALVPSALGAFVISRVGVYACSEAPWLPIILAIVFAFGGEWSAKFAKRRLSGKIDHENLTFNAALVAMATSVIAFVVAGIAVAKVWTNPTLGYILVGFGLLDSAFAARAVYRA